MSMRRELTFALRDGKIVYIDDVENGLKCNCICPSCKSKLIAKQGEITMHHFAHTSGAGCTHGYQNSLCMAIVSILSNTKKMVLPKSMMQFPHKDRMGITVIPAQEIEIEDVKMEKRFNDPFEDIIITSGGRDLCLQLYATHKISDKQVAAYKKANIDIVEIDISQRSSMVTAMDLEWLLKTDCPEKRWLYHQKTKEIFKKILKESIRLPIIHVDGSSCAKDCPISPRIYRDRQYADLFEECLDCKYFVSFENKEIRCLGEKRIAMPEDLELTLEERKQKYDKDLDPAVIDRERKMKIFMAGVCPNCGGKVIKKVGKYSEFLGCNRYPSCKFVARIEKSTGKVIPKL